MKKRNILLIVILIYSCEKGKLLFYPTDIYLNQILPLRVNNSWTAKFTCMDSIETIISTSIETITICCDTIVDGNRYYKYSGYSNIWYFNTDEGLWTIQYNPIHGFGGQQLFYKYPCKSGDNYNRIKVMSVDTTIVVPLGKIKCILYRYPIDQIDSTLEYIDTFLSPGIGQIKSISYRTDANGKQYKFLFYELLNCSLY